MRITILTFGSTGDVLPFVALGKKLMQNGHLVTILATTDSRELIERHGLRFFSAEVNTKAMLKTELGQRFLATQSNGLKTLNLWRQLVSTYASNLPQMYKTASQDADLIIFTLSTFGGHSVAEQKGIPSIITSFFPVTPTGDFPVFIVRNSLGRSLNRLSYRAFEFLFRTLVLAGDNINLQPERLGLTPYKSGPFTTLQNNGVPLLHPFSPTLIPKPKEWPTNVHVTGYWHLDESDWKPPQALLNFLANGPRPVSIGFGSMAIQDAPVVTRTILEALAKTGQRAILSKGWAGIGEGIDLPDNIFLVDFVPHDWLFERVSGIVQHGGAGTTHASLRAGLPTLVVPFTSDQPMWAHSLHQLGISPKPIPLNRLTADKLAKALLDLTDPKLIERARQVGVQVRAEDGVGKAVEAIEQILSNRAVPQPTLL